MPVYDTSILFKESRIRDRVGIWLNRQVGTYYLILPVL